jgi:hypothetical protein
MGRFELTIEYDGTRYTGWQMQKCGKTIQGEILDACRELLGGSKSLGIVVATKLPNSPLIFIILTFSNIQLIKYLI